MGGRTRGPGIRHDVRRREIADAVLEIVAEHGLASVSLSAVAARAGVSPGRVQHYFPAKDGLIAAAFDRGNALSSARISALVGSDPGSAAPRDVLSAVLTELIPHDPATRAHMRVRQAFAAFALSDEAIAARLRTEYARLHRRLADLLRRDQDAGRAPASLEPDTAAVGLTALAEGLAYYVLIGVGSCDAAREQVRAAVDAAYRSR
ncbi:TetR family transcriptional regulator [Murinocardiopsis flavida]|uniref:TetR family transcriptional regulator n=1 Tax=Murinocardiopsis flavida TaxID=645275 RepID=A0A2P8CZ06_9ACTN|nr:TetR family transcriptional regulator C-terminal domain-containing protein [Murinocardiopsis flavida]PSK90190.1 TetR family transcriptional regulator [Murinocardiopsis flavida]